MKSMRIEYACNAMLPGLAWVATVDFSDGVTRVTHGRYVESAEMYFVEGAWGGDFSTGRLSDTEVVFGSGAVASGDHMIFVSSLATTDYLFHARGDAGVVVSNSLSLLLARIGDKLDPRFRRYDVIHNSILLGVNDFIREIPTCKGSVSRTMYHNLDVSADGVREMVKPQPPRFSSYDTYLAYLSESYARLVGNARDPKRVHPLRIYSTQSRGYDSTAVNAIAAKHGVDAVFTVATAKGGGAFSDEQGEPEVNDDGTEIAQLLGVEDVRVLERKAFRAEYADEIYLYASIHEPQDANLKQVSDSMEAPALLLTGTLGELWYTHDLWYNHHPETDSPELRRGDLSLHGLTDTRIRVGFVQAAIPYVGARNRHDILAITESSEMLPWRLGTNYDRPIPRRISEAAGVPRAAFGQNKAGSVVEFTPPHIPQNADLRTAYFAFLVKYGLLRRWRLSLFPVVHAMNRAICFASETRYRALYYSLRAVSKISRRNVTLKPVWGNLRGTLHCFAVNRCAEEYAVALLDAQPSSSAV